MKKILNLFAFVLGICNVTLAETVTLTPSADAWLDYTAAGDKTANYGSATTLRAGIWQDMWTNATPGLKNNKYGAFAIMKFDVSEYSGKLTGATLNITAANSDTRNRDLYIGYYTGTDWTEAEVTAENSGIVARAATGLNIGNFGVLGTVTNGKTMPLSYSNEAFLNYLNNDADGVVTLIFYTLTKNIDINSKEAESGTPSLVLEYTTESVYTATFTETNDVSPVITIYSDEAMTTSVSNGALINGKYYFKAVAEGYEDYTGSFEVASADETVDFTMTAKPRFTFIVNAVDQNGEVLETLFTDEDAYQGKTISCTYPKYRTDANGKVTHKCDATTFYKSYTLDAVRAETISYTEYTGTAYFQEAEGIGTWNGWQDDAKLSGNKAVRAPKSSPATLIKVKEDGVYNITFVTFSTNVKSETTKVYKNGTEEIHSYVLNWAITYATTAGKGLRTIENVSLKAGDVINVVTGASTHAFDYTLIEKTAEVASVSSVGYATFVPSTNVVVPAGVTVYTAKVNDDKASLALTAVPEGTVLGAGQGFIVKADAGSYNFAVTTEKAASLDNDLKAADAPINVSAESNIYVLAKPESSPVGFYRVDANTTVAAGKAYIELTAAKNAAPALTFADSATGISEVKTAGMNAATADFYTLQGVKVNKNTRGLLLHNGKKYMVK